MTGLLRLFTVLQAISAQSYCACFSSIAILEEEPRQSMSAADLQTAENQSLTNLLAWSCLAKTAVIQAHTKHHECACTAVEDVYTVAALGTWYL